MKKILLALLFFALATFPVFVFAQDSFDQKISLAKARVLEVLSQKPQEYQGITGISKTTVVQEIKAVILEGENKGSVVEFLNDYTLLKKGDNFYLNITEKPDGEKSYTLNAPYRLNILFILLVIFLVVVYVFGGTQGLRGLVSLAGSLVLIIFILIPSILNGFSPIIASLGVASLIIVSGSYITHGFNKTTTAAVLGMIISVLITGAMAYYAMTLANLRGLDEYALYLNISSDITIDLVGLLFGGIMIGLLGVLYDAAISQAIAIEELHKVAPHLNRWTIYQRGMRIGREHIGALVDTIAIAYVGVSLPLILLYAKSPESLFITINQEIFATEIIRILISSIGLILAVPITTFIASYIIIKNNTTSFDPAIIKKEQEDLDRFNHTH